MYSCNAIERELSESVSRKVGQILEVDFYNSLKEGEPERRLTNKSSNLESYLSSENKKRLEETYCSTEGPSSSKSQQRSQNIILIQIFIDRIYIHPIEHRTIEIVAHVAWDSQPA